MEMLSLNKLVEQHESSLLLFTILVIFFIALFRSLISCLSRKRRRLPPSPLKLPIIGNLHNIGLYPYRSLWHLAQHFGPLMLLHFGAAEALIVSSANGAREIMKTHDIIFANRPRSRASQKLLYNYKDIATAPYGEYWRQMKSISVVHLLSNKRIQSFRAVREEETALMIDEIERASSSSSPINLSEILATLTNNVVCRAALGRKYGGESGRKFSKLLSEFVEHLGVFNVGNFIPWLAWVSHVNGLEARMDKVAKEFDDFLEGVVEEHMAQQKKGPNTDSVNGEEQKDFVDVLLWIQRENLAGFKIDRVRIKAVLLDVFAAGTDTTYTSLEWAMTILLRHPNVMKQLQKEVREIAGEKSDIKEKDLEKMHYLKAVIKETLRLHPPIPLLVPRESAQDIEVMGYNIAAGTRVIVNAWAIGRDPMSWEQPEEFIPERFLNSSIDFKGHDFQLIPFGSGRRGCPGILFAATINELFLANLVHKFDWTLPGGAKEKDIDISESIGIAIHRKFPLIAIANRCSC
ncbi:hypothetical protein SLE2022_022630 [Rubroshorea leprosula]